MGGSDFLVMMPYALTPVVAITVGLVVFWILRRDSQSLKIVGSNLESVAGQAEVDLAKMQMEDVYGAISEGWNRLITEVNDARDELDAYHVQQQAMETIGQYHSNWITELLNKMSFGLLMVGEDESVTFINSMAERLLGQQQDEVLGRNISAILGSPLDSAALHGGGAIDRTFDLESTGASVRIKAMRIASPGSDGQTALFLQDISHQKEMQRARDQFLYHITHELRTPLTNIRAYAETLSEGVLEDRDSLRECYNVIIGETERLSRLVEDILSVSQLEAGLARLEVGEVQTARLIRQVVEDMQASADEKDVELTLSMPSKVPTIRGDKERLAIVLTNLVGNAVKYTPAGGQVEVMCVEDGRRLQIVVRDTGYGIASEEQEKVFEKFYRAQDEEVTQLPGTGLGLAIARETARAHGGDIELESELGKGSTFTVSLPIGRSSVIKTAGD